MSVVVCGSMAFDTIMVFPDRFQRHILPEKVHILNVSFLVPDMRREFGGCAGNIAYNLKLLGLDPLPVATVGRDFEPYARWLDGCGIRRSGLMELTDTYTAQAFITTDLDDNQITAFHPGAMSMSHLNTVPIDTSIRLGVVAPDGKDGMQLHARQFAEAGIPFIFDPGQGMPQFDGEELCAMVELARWVTLNDYEAQLMVDRTGLSLDDLAQRVEALVITRGAEGSEICTASGRYVIPTAQAAQLSDPTGCGDAYRAGLIYGILASFDWGTTGRLAALMGAINIEVHGTQNHRVTMDDIRARFKVSFGYEF